jgi:hypothetical protein
LRPLDKNGGHEQENEHGRRRHASKNLAS